MAVLAAVEQHLIGRDRERGKRLRRRHVGLGVPLRAVQQVERAERAAVPRHRHVQHRIAADRGDQRGVEDHAAAVLGGAAVPRRC
jgi:hypothetical protein